jgi:hypothetical protein
MTARCSCGLVEWGGLAVVVTWFALSKVTVMVGEGWGGGLAGLAWSGLVCQGWGWRGVLWRLRKRLLRLREGLYFGLRDRFFCRLYPFFDFCHPTSTKLSIIVLTRSLRCYLASRHSLYIKLLYNFLIVCSSKKFHILSACINICRMEFRVKLLWDIARLSTTAQDCLLGWSNKFSRGMLEAFTMLWG